MLSKGQKISNSLKIAHKNKLWGFVRGNKIGLGRKLSEAHKQKLREARAKRITSEITKKRISEALKGKVKSWEHRKKLSEANKGKRLSDETRRKISEALKGRYGKDTGGWKGGSLNYWKRAVKRRDGKCVKCGNNDSRVLTADHIKSKKMYPNLIYDIDNGITLCYNCHAIKTLEDKEYRYWMSSNHWNKK